MFRRKLHVVLIISLFETSFGDSNFDKNSAHIPTPTSLSPLSCESSSGVASLVEVFEHEFHDHSRNAWIGGSTPNMTQRWTSSPTNFDQHRALPPPPQLLPPKGYNYTSEWKIDITGTTCTRDELGWEYFIDQNDRTGLNGRRRRRWLRSVSENYVSNSNSTSLDKTTKGQYTTRLPSSRGKVRRVKYLNERFFREIGDSFNFKGYGISFHKSLLHRQSAGVTLRLPLTIHFDFFETRPWLPLLTSTCVLYYPLRCAFSINASLPVALFKYVILTMLDQLKFCFMLLWYLITKTIMNDIVKILILSNIGKILGFGGDKSDCEKIQYDRSGEPIGNIDSFRSKFKSFKEYPSLPAKREVSYSSSIAERLGFSMTWHLSTENCCELKCSWWHCVLPTIEHILEVGRSSMGPFMKSKLDVLSRSEQLLTLKEWMRQKVGSLGLIWGGFTPDVPFYSCNLALSMSGFYYGGDSLKKMYTVPRKLFLSKDMSSEGIDKVRRSEKKREKKFQDILNVNDESDCEIIDVKVSAS